MLELRQIHTYYGDSHILQGISLKVDKGKIVGLLGRNGMGKTTLIRSIVGFTPPRQGEVLFKERDITAWSSNRVINFGLGLVPQGRRVFSSLTVFENLTVADRRNGGPWTLERVMELFPRLCERRAIRAGKLSGGEQQRVAIARAFMNRPKILFADEPTGNLDAETAGEIVRLIFDLNATTGTTLILVTHDRDLTERADRVISLKAGKLIADTKAPAGFSSRVTKA